MVQETRVEVVQGEGRIIIQQGLQVEQAHPGAGVPHGTHIGEAVGRRCLVWSDDTHLHAGLALVESARQCPVGRSIHPGGRSKIDGDGLSRSLLPGSSHDDGDGCSLSRLHQLLLQGSLSLGKRLLNRLATEGVSNSKFRLKLLRAYGKEWNKMLGSVARHFGRL